jgi:Aminoglycoside-2''-adenylyltransferase
MQAAAFEPDLSKWDAWSPKEVAKRLERLAAPWYVAAGWALDLFLGAQRRDHDDLEIAVPRARLDEVFAAIGDPELLAVGSGRATPIAGAPDIPESSHQTWVRERGTELWRLDIFGEPSDGDVWVCRRDERIRLPYDRVIEHTADGIPYGRPEIVLLFKAKHARPKDEDDLAAVLPRLSAARRRWLAEALALLHPGHRWLTELD